MYSSVLHLIQAFTIIMASNSVKVQYITSTGQVVYSYSTHMFGPASSLILKNIPGTGQ